MRYTIIITNHIVPLVSRILTCANDCLCRIRIMSFLVKSTGTVQETWLFSALTTSSYCLDVT